MPRPQFNNNSFDGDCTLISNWRDKDTGNPLGRLPLDTEDWYLLDLPYAGSGTCARLIYDHVGLGTLSTVGAGSDTLSITVTVGLVNWSWDSMPLRSDTSPTLIFPNSPIHIDNVAVGTNDLMLSDLSGINGCTYYMMSIGSINITDDGSGDFGPVTFNAATLTDWKRGATAFANASSIFNGLVILPDVPATGSPTDMLGTYNAGITAKSVPALTSICTAGTASVASFTAQQNGADVVVNGGVTTYQPSNYTGGSLTIAATVRTLTWNIAPSNTAVTTIMPDPTDVISGSGNYGFITTNLVPAAGTPTNPDYVLESQGGNWVEPDPSKVEHGYTYGVSDSLTGTQPAIHYPAAGKVVTSAGNFGPDAGTVPTYEEVDPSDVRESTLYGPNSTIEGTLASNGTSPTFSGNNGKFWRAA